MTSETPEIKKIESAPKQEKKQVWQIVQDIYGKDWKAKMPELAEKFGICDKETYIKARAEGKNAEYNIKIGERLQKGERLEPEAINKKIEKFTDPDKQRFLREHPEEVDQQYLANMDDEDLAKLDNPNVELSLVQGFLRNQKEAIQEKKDKISSVGGFEGVNIDQAATNLELFEFDEDLIAFLSKAKKAGDIDVQDLRNARNEATLKVNSASEEDIKNAGGKEALQRQLERMELLKMAKEKGLDQKYESEFNDLAVRLYELNKENTRLQKFRDKELLKYIKKVASVFERSKAASPDALDKEKGKIMGTSVIQGYLTEEKSNLTFLVEDEDMKDEGYRDNLKKKYDPTMGNMIKKIYVAHGISEQDQKLFDENTGKLKADISSQERERLEPKSKEIQPLVEEQFKNAEGEILKVWNPAIKEQAVSTCIDSLRHCMNFSLDEGDRENLLSSLKVEESKATIENADDRVVKIKGKVGEKDLTVFYNLTTGTIETEKFLKKDVVAGTYYIDDEEKGREQIMGLKLPKLDDFTHKVESRGDQGRKEILLKSENIEDMKKNLQTKLDREVRADHRSSIEPSHFEKIAVQNMFVQEVMSDFIRFPKHGFSEIGSRNPEYFQLCDLINNAANRYTKDELKRGRDVVKELKDIKEKRITYHPSLKDTAPIKNMQKNNPERYTFEMAFCPYMVDKINYRTVPENNTCLKFFSCFKSPKSDSFPMIDLDMLGDYTSKLSKKINREEDNTMARKRTPAFEKSKEELESQLLIASIEDVDFNDERKKV